MVVLSNIDNHSYVHSNAKLHIEFDAIYTTENVGSYKPADRNFAYMLDKLKSIGVTRGQVLHTAESMFHEHALANKFSLANRHIYRRHGAEGFGATMTPEMIPSYNFRFNSMADLVEAYQPELGA